MTDLPHLRPAEPPVPAGLPVPLRRSARLLLVGTGLQALSALLHELLRLDLPVPVRTATHDLTLYPALAWFLGLALASLALGRWLGRLPDPAGRFGIAFVVVAWIGGVVELFDPFHWHVGGFLHGLAELGVLAAAMAFAGLRTRQWVGVALVAAATVWGGRLLGTFGGVLPVGSLALIRPVGVALLAALAATAGDPVEPENLA